MIQGIASVVLGRPFAIQVASRSSTSLAPPSKLILVQCVQAMTQQNILPETEYKDENPINIAQLSKLRRSRKEKVIWLYTVAM